MSIRLAILLSGSLVVSAAGGVMASLPVLLADGQRVPNQSAPSPELDQSRRIVLASLESSRDEVRRRLGELELLAELMADAAPRREPLFVETGLIGPDIQR